MIIADWQIEALVNQKKMISPFSDRQVRFEGNSDLAKVSYGLSSFGYDARLANKLVHCLPSTEGYIDPKNFNQDLFQTFKGDSFTIPANSFALGSTKEYFKMPDDMFALCVGKSTYARCGLITNTTPLEPGWEGNITLELSNSTPYPIKVYANEGIIQVVFFQGVEPATTYAKKQGKYQGQKGIVFPRA